jgi:ERCC4-type nuclease
VRLASRLFGWELDIRTKEQLEKETAQEKAKAEEELKQAQQEAALLAEISGVGKKLLLNLQEAGFNSPGDIVNKGLKELQKVKGIGEKKAEKILKEAKKLIKKASSQKKDGDENSEKRKNKK